MLFKRLFLIVLMVLTIGLVGCNNGKNEYHPKIEKFDWEFVVAYCFSEEYYNSREPHFLAVDGDFADGEWSKAPIKNIILEAENGVISIWDKDLNTTYLGHYIIAGNDQNNITTYYAAINGQDVKGGNLVGHWQVQYRDEKEDPFYDINDAPYHRLTGSFDRIEPVYDEFANERMVKFTYCFEFICF